MQKIYYNNKSVAPPYAICIWQLCGRGQIFRAHSARNYFDFLGPGIIGRSAPPLVVLDIKLECY